MDVCGMFLINVRQTRRSENIVLRAVLALQNSLKNPTEKIFLLSSGKFFLFVIFFLYLPSQNLLIHSFSRPTFFNTGVHPVRLSNAP